MAGYEPLLMTLAWNLGILLLAVSLPGICTPAPGRYQASAWQDQTAPTPEAPPPSTEAPPAATQQEQTNPPAPPPNPPSNQTQPQTTQAPTNQPVTKKKKRRKKKTSPAPATSADGPTKTVVKNGSTAEPEVKFSPGTTTDQQNRQRGKVNYLLTSTDGNLKKLSTRQLNSSQQDAVQQIRTYMEQAKAALTEGDLQRGENLATKARLLSDDLLKQ
jgi:outer membrane biosynthesis protein TonB